MLSFLRSDDGQIAVGMLHASVEDRRIVGHRRVLREKEFKRIPSNHSKPDARSWLSWSILDTQLLVLWSSFYSGAQENCIGILDT